MGFINLLPARIILLVVILLIALFVLPEGIINKVPYAPVIKNYLEDTFSQTLNTFEELSQKSLIWIDDTAIGVRDEFNKAQSKTQLFVKEKMEAIDDIMKAIDAINRLLGRTPSATDANMEQ